MQQQYLNKGIDWKFIPFRSPYFGGMWEAAVKTAKYHFYRTVGLHVLTFDELRTRQISAIMNSHPLCPITEDPDDIDFLTPGHFLIGCSFLSINEPNITDVNCNGLSRWQLVDQMQQIFWKKWSTSYLTLLQVRYKWKTLLKNIVIGSMVLIKNENSPPLKWQMGSVTHIIIGKDKVVRYAMVRTSGGIVKHIITKFAISPIDGSVVEPTTAMEEECLYNDQSY